MTASCFVDANVLIYSVDAAQTLKRAAAIGWLRHLWELKAGRISVQVLNEFYVIATAKLASPVRPDDARAVVKQYLAWQPVAVDATMLTQAFEIQDRFGFSHWDSLIVAAAKLSGCGLLLTEDLQHMQDIDGLRVINPFRAEPAEHFS